MKFIDLLNRDFWFTHGDNTFKYPTQSRDRSNNQTPNLNQFDIWFKSFSGQFPVNSKISCMLLLADLTPFSTKLKIMKHGYPGALQRIFDGTSQVWPSKQLRLLHVSLERLRQCSPQGWWTSENLSLSRSTWVTNWSTYFIVHWFQHIKLPPFSAWNPQVTRLASLRVSPRGS